MSDTSTSCSVEATFRAFSEKQGINYAQNRHDYHPKLYQEVLNYHASTGGHLDTILDVGCGPGTAVRSLAPLFTHAIGIDPSDGMINAARAIGGITRTEEPIRFNISTAEELGSGISPPIPHGSVDIIIAATAAHWFEMSSFWTRAAEVLKPGGSVALWTSGPIRVDPSMPGSVGIQAAIDRLEESMDEFMVMGNRLNRDLYVNLPLPWTLKTPVLGYEEASLVRKEWGTGPASQPADQFYFNNQPADLDALEKVLGTTSPVMRWREAHPGLVGTENDRVRVMRREIEAALYQAGVEKGQELINGGVAGVLLMVKRTA